MAAWNNKKKNYQLVAYLGHCGGGPNQYLVYEGNMFECRLWRKQLPRQKSDTTCSQCGGYTGTVPVREVCEVEFNYQYQSGPLLDETA